MKRTFSSSNSKNKPDGMLRAVRFPQLAMMGVETGDHRLLEADGGGVRDLPRTIFAQFAQAGGHMGSVPVGRLDSVALDSETGLVDGEGWLIDLPHVRDVFVPLIATGTLRHNSVDLAECEVEWVWKSDDPMSEDFWKYTIVFTQWNVAATTIVGVPAFADARVELDEVTASLIASDEPLEWRFDTTDIRIVGVDDEITASLAVADAAATVPWADFHIPETQTFQKIRVDAQGRVFGHLAAWGECHEGIEGQCILAPRPDSYDEYNLDGPLTERGPVGTGPIFFLGGHPEKPLGKGDRWKAYGGVENAWADVRVTNGVLGPWTSGRITPGLSQEALYRARASRISGHWRANGSLAAIVSCNVPAFNVGSDPETRAALRLPDSQLYADRDGVVIRDGEVVEMVASLHVAELQRFEKFQEAGSVMGSITITNPAVQYVVAGDGGGPLQIKVPAGMDPAIVTARLRSLKVTEVGDKINEALEAAVDEPDEDVEFLIEMDLDEIEDALDELPMSG